MWKSIAQWLVAAVSNIRILWHILFSSALVKIVGTSVSSSTIALLDKPLVEKKTYESIAIDRFIASTNVPNRNANMPAIMYNRPEFKKIMAAGGTAALELEREWRARSIYEFTPAGGILMCYDAFKEGFVYRCDTTAVSYSILNAVAVKYIHVFKCRDLFVDTSISTSPLAQASMDELRIENEKKRELVNKMANTVVTQSTSPFANFRSYNKTSGLVPAISATLPEVETGVRNRFIYAGRASGLVDKSKHPSRMAKPVSYAEFRAAAKKRQDSQ